MVCLYIIKVCTDGTTMGICQCALLAAIGRECYWMIVVSCEHLCGHCIVMNGFASLFAGLLYHYALLC